MVNVVRKDLDAGNINLTKAIRVMKTLNLKLGEMRFIIDLDKKINELRREYDKLKREKAVALGGIIDEKTGSISFPDEKQKEGLAFHAEVLAYFEEEESLDMEVQEVIFKEEFNLTANIVEPLTPFVRFVELK